MLHGSRCFGDIRFTVSGAPMGASVCHCGQCRKMSGHTWSSAYVPATAIAVAGPVAWFASSDVAQRGICPRCGSFLFWKARANETMRFAPGAIDGATGLALEKHIFVAHKGDYYEVKDGLPQKE